MEGSDLARAMSMLKMRYGSAAEGAMRTLERKSPVAHGAIKGWMKGVQVPIPLAGEAGAVAGGIKAAWDDGLTRRILNRKTTVTGQRVGSGRKNHNERRGDDVLERLREKKLTPIRMSSKLRRIQFISQEQRDILESAKHMGASAGITGAVGGTALSLLGKSTEEVAPLGKWAATKRAIKTGGKAGLGLGAAGVIASLTGAALLGRPRKGDKAVATKQGAIGGAVVGAGAGALIGAMARRPGAAKNFIDRQALHWKPVEAIQKGGLAKRLTIGSLAGGVFGAGHMADEGQQVDTLRNLKREKRMSSKLRHIQFITIADLIAAPAVGAAVGAAIGKSDRKRGAKRGAKIGAASVIGAGVGSSLLPAIIRRGTPLGAPLGAALGGYLAHRATREKQMSSRLKSIQFGPSNEVFTSQGLTGKLAKDRYIKKIKDDDLDRRDANILRSAAAGAATGGLLRGRKGAAIGAGAGLASVLGIRAATKSSKDMYGERSREGKSAESMPWKAGTLAAAGLGARAVGRKIKDMKKAKIGAGVLGAGWLANKLFFRSRLGLIQFALPRDKDGKIIHKPGTMSRNIRAGTIFDTDLGREYHKAITRQIEPVDAVFKRVKSQPTHIAAGGERVVNPDAFREIKTKGVYRSAGGARKVGTLVESKPRPGLPFSPAAGGKIVKNKGADWRKGVFKTVDQQRSAGSALIQGERDVRPIDLRDYKAFRRVKALEGAASANPGIFKQLKEARGMDRAAVDEAKAAGEEIKGNARRANERSVMAGVTKVVGKQARQETKEGFQGMRNEAARETRINRNIIKQVRVAQANPNFYKGYKAGAGEAETLATARAKYDEITGNAVKSDLAKTKAIGEAEMRGLHGNLSTKLAQHIGARDHGPEWHKSAVPGVTAGVQGAASKKATELLRLLESPVPPSRVAGAHPYADLAKETGVSTTDLDDLRKKHSALVNAGVDQERSARARLGANGGFKWAIREAAMPPPARIKTHLRSFPILKGTAITAGVLGAAALGGKLLSDRRKKQEAQKLLMGSRIRAIRFAAATSTGAWIRKLKSAPPESVKIVERIMGESKAALTAPANRVASHASAGVNSMNDALSGALKAPGKSFNPADPKIAALRSQPNTAPEHIGSDKTNWGAAESKAHLDVTSTKAKSATSADKADTAAKAAHQRRLLHSVARRYSNAINELRSIRSGNHNKRLIESNESLAAENLRLNETLAGAQSYMRKNTKRVIGENSRKHAESAARNKKAAAGALSESETRGYRNAAIAGGLGLAGGIAIAPRDSNKKTMKLTSKLRAIRFEIDEDARDMRRASSFAKTAQQYTKRGTALAQDLIRAAKGQKNLDSRGRERKREWDRPWVRTAATGAVLTAGALLGRRIYKGTGPDSTMGILRTKIANGELGSAMRHSHPRTMKVIDKMRSFFPSAANEGASLTERSGIPGKAVKWIDETNKAKQAAMEAAGAPKKVVNIAPVAEDQNVIDAVAAFRKVPGAKPKEFRSKARTIQLIAEERIDGDLYKPVRLIHRRPKRNPRTNAQHVAESADWNMFRNALLGTSAALGGYGLGRSTAWGAAAGGMTGTPGGGAPAGSVSRGVQSATHADALATARRLAASKGLQVLRHSAIIPSSSIIRLSSRLDALIG